MHRYEAESVTPDYWPVLCLDDHKHSLTHSNFSHLDHDKFPLPGPPIGPLLSKTQADFKGRQAWCLAALVGYHTCATHKPIY